MSVHFATIKGFGPAVKDFEFTVPADYVHSTQLDTFRAKTEPLKTTYYYDGSLTSANFAKATNKLEPGKTYRAKIFPIMSKVSSEDCLNFLAKQKAILVGGQGLTLVQSLRPTEFPVGKYTVSFDQEDALWTDSEGYPRVPNVYRGDYSDDVWGFGLRYFGWPWNADICLLCVCDL